MGEPFENQAIRGCFDAQDAGMRLAIRLRMMRLRALSVAVLVAASSVAACAKTNPVTPGLGGGGAGGATGNGGAGGGTTDAVGAGGQLPVATTNGVGGATSAGPVTTAGAGGGGPAATVGSGAPSCAPGQEMCGAQCVNTNTDPNNCGACGNSCNGFSCCNGQCTDTSADQNNCGACGAVCAPSQQCITDGWLINKCQSGQCKAVTTSCGRYRCDQATKTCWHSCTPGAGDCFTGSYCDAATDKCVAQGGLGASCQNNGQCVSNNCHLGHCA